MSKAKIICMCGSLKHIEEIDFNAFKLALEGNCVLSLNTPTKANKDVITEDELDLLHLLHKQKIDMSDAIFVVNFGGYIGGTTKNEIEYATKLGKEIIYLEQPI